MSSLRRLFVLTIPKDNGWDQYDGFAILAKDEQEAREMAELYSQNFTSQPEHDFSVKAECVEIPLFVGDSRIVLTSFKNG